MESHNFDLPNILTDTMSLPSISTSPFDRLPQETLAHVASYLDHPDIGIFRLAQRKCAMAGLEALVSDLTLMFSMKSFQLAQHRKGSYHDSICQDCLVRRYEHGTV
jgi:hypothetical protein